MYSEIKNYLSNGIYPFHMPGHKRNAAFFPPGLIDFDLTEITGTDNLSEPTGIIENLQKKIAEKFHAESSFLLTNGSSAGIVAAICACANEQTPIYIPRNAHISTYNGLIFSGAKPIYFLPELNTGGLFGNVSPKCFENISKNAVVFIVSPTYEGFVSDISLIAETVHARGGILIVDEAHGAHFTFHDYFPKSAMQQGADMAINSLHKTLPAISGCAVLHARGNRVDFSRIKFFINAMQTTSPSYLMMAQCDFMLNKLSENPVLFEEYVSKLIETRNLLQKSDAETPLRLIETDDKGKLLFSINALKSAEEISQIMSRKYKIECETAKRKHLLAMTSVADTQEGFSRLLSAVHELNRKLPFIYTEENLHRPVLPEIVFSPREALQKESEIIPGENANGRICAEIITEYPPGIALAVPGEIINGQIKRPFIRVVK